MKPQVGSMNATARRTFRCRYLSWAPAGGRPGARRRAPLVLFLHGSGERGTNLDLVTRHGPPRLAAAGRRFPFYLVAPQCPADRIWCPETLHALLAECLRQWPVDPARVYLTGISMGGHGTWVLANTYPERFAAIAPVCGPFTWIAPERFQGLPTWCFHGALDEAVPIQDSIRLVQMLRGAGVPVRFTVYPDANHDAWTPTYANPALYRWLLAQRRPAAEPGDSQ